MRRLAAAAFSCLALMSPERARACTLGRLAELPLTLDGASPLVTAQVNGRDAAFLVDSGAFYSLLTPRGAAALGVRPNHVFADAELVGVGGVVRAQVAIADTFRLAGATFSKVAFLLEDTPYAPSATGVLGQNVWRLGDVEYDLPEHTIRLFAPHDCDTGPGLAYWAGDAHVSQLALAVATPEQPHATALIAVNGVRLRALFDTGAQRSMISPAAAARAGLTRLSDASPVTAQITGVGGRTVPVWTGAFRTVDLGDEEARGGQLTVGELGVGHVDMLVGVDFFLSHRVYIAGARGRMFFTYVGGSMFGVGGTGAH